MRKTPSSMGRSAAQPAPIVVCRLSERNTVSDEQPRSSTTADETVSHAQPGGNNQARREGGPHASPTGSIEAICASQEQRLFASCDYPNGPIRRDSSGARATRGSDIRYGELDPRTRRYASVPSHRSAPLNPHTARRRVSLLALLPSRGVPPPNLSPCEGADVPSRSPITRTYSNHNSREVSRGLVGVIQRGGAATLRA